jgi:hypothetical protein
MIAVSRFPAAAPLVIVLAATALIAILVLWRDPVEARHMGITVMLRMAELSRVLMDIVHIASEHPLSRESKDAPEKKKERKR